MKRSPILFISFLILLAIGSQLVSGPAIASPGDISVADFTFLVPYEHAADPVYICSDTIIKTPSGKCVRVGCKRLDNCEQCCLVWKDLDGNGQIERKELRCKCRQGEPSTQPLCEFKRKVVPCTD